MLTKICCENFVDIALLERSKELSFLATNELIRRELDFCVWMNNTHNI